MKPGKAGTRRLLLPVTLLAFVALFGHRWLALGWAAWGYPVAAPAARTQVVVADGRAYVAAGVEGIEVVDLDGARKSVLIPPVAEMDRVDDLAVADGLLFALDATPPGHLATYSLADPDRPAPTGAIVPVPVGPFSGVSAAAGLVIVSGGTSRLTLREFGRDGSLGAEVTTADFGRGQPDVALRSDGKMAAISTHLYGPEFAVTFVAVDRHPLRLRQIAQLRLPEAGFTAGGYKPAHFPLATAWRGDRVYVAEGAGLDVIDLADPAHPRLAQRYRQASPALDVLVAGDELTVLRAGARPAVLRYRLDAVGLPVPFGVWRLPAGRRPGAISPCGAGILVTEHEHGWECLAPRRLSSLHVVQP